MEAVYCYYLIDSFTSSNKSNISQKLIDKIMKVRIRNPKNNIGLLMGQNHLLKI